MELLEGESLSTHRRRIGVLSEARAVALCAGRSVIRWAVAHGKGIVHHDLRPGTRRSNYRDATTKDKKDE
jgi:hypothetical protein